MNITWEASIVLRKRLEEAQSAIRHGRITGGLEYRAVVTEIKVTDGKKKKVAKVHVPADANGNPLVLDWLGTLEDKPAELKADFESLCRAIRDGRLTGETKLQMVAVPVNGKPGTYDFFAADANNRPFGFLGAVRGNPNVTDVGVPLAEGCAV